MFSSGALILLHILLYSTPYSHGTVSLGLPKSEERIQWVTAPTEVLHKKDPNEMCTGEYCTKAIAEIDEYPYFARVDVDCYEYEFIKQCSKRTKREALFLPRFPPYHRKRPIRFPTYLKECNGTESYTKERKLSGRHTDYCLIISSTHILCSHRRFDPVNNFSCSGTAQFVADGSQHEVESVLKRQGVTLYKLKSHIEANSQAKPITTVFSKPQPGTEVTLVSLLLGEGDSSNRNVLVQTENSTLIPPDDCTKSFFMTLSQCSSYLWIEQSYRLSYTYGTSFLLVQGKLAGMQMGGANFFLRGDRSRGFVNVARINGSIEYPRDD